ncbi:Uncharacterized conserved protein UCP015417 vWA [Zea mays]|jgi:hypothetical protein|uniref:Uncharacterized conserved protein UCP015417 vWA n=1 Tax=Zea mays TaxID=4577 RepID=A0A1D6NXR4_MAIZE|nr:Uncharacterized conserved protein UCP015417 vWA [Zea mays]
MRKLAAGKVRKFSLAAKWCPSLDSSYDHSTLICEAVARRLFPKGSAPELAADLADEYAYRARAALQGGARAAPPRAQAPRGLHLGARVGVS